MNESTSGYKRAACERVGDLPLVHLRDSFLTGAGTSHHRRLYDKVDRRNVWMSGLDCMRQPKVMRSSIGGLLPMLTSVRSQTLE